VTADESIQRFGLVPIDAALPEIRRLLALEIETERSGGEREEDLTLLCCVQLFSRGLLEDVLPIWEAKSTSMDLGGVVSVQFLCGAGLRTTKDFLAAQPGTAAAAALRYLQGCETAGDFKDFSPEEYLDGYRTYFGAV
jgi:hypothetical protein